MTRRLSRWTVAAGTVALLALGTTASAASPAPDAFSDDSYWNTPVGNDATVHSNSDGIIDFLVADNDLDGCITLAGHPGNDWGMPVFVADASDPAYNVTSTNWTVPPEFSSLRIPEGAVAADTSDGEMVVYDLEAGIVAQLSKAVYDDIKDSWSVSGGSVAYLDSNGLDGRLAESDEPKNDGTFRGYPGAVAMVHYDDVADGALDNVVKIGVNTAHEGHVFPMLGSDGDTTDPDAPKQGTRIRIKQSVDLKALGLKGQALTIAQGLQEYGMIVGDSTGGAIVLKLEDTIAGGRGSLWDLDRESLCAIQGQHLEVIADAGTPPPAGPPSATGFTDIVGHLFQDDIEWLAETGITDGCAATLFCPDDPVTRGQMAAFLSRALGLGSAPSAGFTDTKGHLFETDIDKLAASGITDGCAATLFCPDASVTRGQMAAFLTRALPLGTAPSAGFTDTKGHLFEADIDSLAESGITQGCGASIFCPNDSVTRGQMAAFLRRALDS